MSPTLQVIGCNGES